VGTHNLLLLLKGLCILPLMVQRCNLPRQIDATAVHAGRPAVCNT
jgi:hypothetical protein